MVYVINFLFYCFRKQILMSVPKVLLTVILMLTVITRKEAINVLANLGILAVEHLEIAEVTV